MGWAERIEQVTDRLLFSLYLVLTTSLTCNCEILCENVGSDISRRTSQCFSESRVLRTFFSCIFVAVAESRDSNAEGERLLPFQATLVGIE